MLESPSLQFRTVTIRAALREAVEHYQAGRHDEARGICEQLLQQRPSNVDALHLMGVLEIQRGQYATAQPFFEKAIALQQNNAEIFCNYGSLLSHLKQPEEAIQQLHRALTLRPDYAEAHLNLATVLLDEEDLAGAIAEFQHASRLNPRMSDAPNGLGCAQSRRGLIPEAIGSFRQAVGLNAENSAAHCNLAMLLLGAGAFVEGWREYEWRLRGKNARPFRVPRWNGEPLKGRTLLVASEQGLGDTIQFMRYLPELRQQGAKIVFECRAELKPLLSSYRCVNLLIDWPRASDVESGVDCYVPLLSVPLSFRTTLTTIPANVPYVAADPERVKAWRRKIDGAGIKVGLVWSGNPTYVGDRFRTCALGDLAPLVAVPGLSFFSLQKGAGAEQAANPPPGMTLVSLGEQLMDFGDTAAAISHLDLLISVDTSVAHLAGAMGKAVWMLLPFASDWRWLRRREDTPWYPTMRLFRQAQRGEWRSTIARVAEALRQWRPGSAAERIFRAPEPLDEALDHFRAGRRDQAERCCRRLLEDQPNHEDALRFLGEILVQDDRVADAIEAFECAAQFRPGDAVLHFNLGVMLMQSGRKDEALACYQRALAIDPSNAETHFNLANVLRDDGRPQEAIYHYQNALAARPGYVKAQINLANALRREGRADEAMAEFQRVLDCQPGHGRAHYGLALCLAEKGDSQSATAHLEQAASVDPNLPEVQNHLGRALQEQQRLVEAQRCFERAIQLRPHYVEALANLAANLFRQGQGPAAETALRHALSLQPSPESACYLARVAATELGRIDPAVTLLRQVLLARPDWPEAHHDLGSLLLYQGNLREGFAEQEWRRRLTGSTPLAFSQPQWDGSALQGKTILLYGEQGYGDIMQMARYVPLIVERGGKVVVGCAASLVRLFATLPDVVAASERIDALPPFEVCASLLSLPHLLGTTLETIPAEAPYLSAPSDGVRLPQAAGNRPKVGITWSGNSRHKSDPQRSCNVRYFRQLVAQQPNIAFYCLQVDSTEDRRALCNELDVIDLAPLLTDWAATASAITQLDLVISVDTAVAHLAGALAKPVWTLLAFTSDPRWLLDRDDSPWYPSMRLFRQKRPGDWDDVFCRLAAALRTLPGPTPLPVKGKLRS